MTRISKLFGSNLISWLQLQFYLIVLARAPAGFRISFPSSTESHPSKRLRYPLYVNAKQTIINKHIKMKKHESMFAVAAETAANSIFHMAHGAVLVRSGVILASASNQLGGNRLSPTCPSTHAEIATLARFFGGSVKQCFEKP